MARTRAQAAATTAPQLAPGVTMDEQGNFLNDRGYPMPAPGDYELEIIDAELTEQPPNKYNPQPSETWRLRVALLGTKQSVGEYAEEQFTATIFVNKPRRDSLFYKDPTTKQVKPTHAALLLTTMGMDVPQNAKFSKIPCEDLIGGFLRGFVGHSSSGYADIRIKRSEELPNGDIANRGLKPVVNEDQLEFNRKLGDELFG